MALFTNAPAIAARYRLSDKTVREWGIVKGAELLRRLQRMARNREWELEWRPDRGKGSHGLLVVNGRRTIIPDLKAELKKGTFHSVLSDLGVTAEDLHRS